jgi:hypothetical protein
MDGRGLHAWMTVTRVTSHEAVASGSLAVATVLPVTAAGLRLALALVAGADVHLRQTNCLKVRDSERKQRTWTTKATHSLTHRQEGAAARRLDTAVVKVGFVQCTFAGKSQQLCCRVSIQLACVALPSHPAPAH